MSLEQKATTQKWLAILLMLRKSVLVLFAIGISMLLFGIISVIGIHFKR